MLHTILNSSIKREIKDTLIISIPLIVAQLIYASSSFIGTALVAKLGEDALAASVLVSMIWISLSVLFFGILNAISVLVSHQHGAENDKKISDIMGQAFLLGILVSLLIILVLSAMPILLRLSHQPPTVLTLSYDYMRSLLWTVPGLVILIICEQFLAGIGRVKLVLQMSLLVVPIEIPLIYCLIFGKFGLPHCGVAGIGYGFAITYTSTAILLIWYLTTSHHYARYQIFSKMNRIDFTYLNAFFRLGLPIGLMHLIEVSTFAAATWWIGQFGTTLLAAHQMVIQYLNFVITIVFAMSEAVTIRVGHAAGKQDLMGVHYAIYTGMLLNFCCISVIACVFYFFPHLLLQFDLDIYLPANASLVNDGSVLLSICAILIIFDNFRIIGFGALRGLKDTRFSMLATFISFWLIGLSLSYFLGFTYQLDAAGIWWGLTLAIGCGAIIILARLRHLLKNMNLTKLIALVSV